MQECMLCLYGMHTVQQQYAVDLRRGGSLLFWANFFSDGGPKKSEGPRFPMTSQVTSHNAQSIRAFWKLNPTQ